MDVIVSECDSECDGECDVMANNHNVLPHVASDDNVHVKVTGDITYSQSNS